LTGFFGAGCEVAVEMVPEAAAGISSPAAFSLLSSSALSSSPSSVVPFSASAAVPALQIRVQAQGMVLPRLQYQTNRSL